MHWVCRFDDSLALKWPFLAPESTLAPLLVLLALAGLTTQLRRSSVLARRPYLSVMRITATKVTACVCYAALALSHGSRLVYRAATPGAPFGVFFEACLLAVWVVAEVNWLLALYTAFFNGATIVPLLTSCLYYCLPTRHGVGQGPRHLPYCRFCLVLFCLSAGNVAARGCRRLHAPPAIIL